MSNKFPNASEQEAAIWIVDILLSGHDGDNLENFNPVNYSSIIPTRGFLNNLGYIFLFIAEIILGFIVLVLSFTKSTKQFYFKKIQFIIGILSIFNIILSTGYLAYTFLCRIQDSTDSPNKFCNYCHSNDEFVNGIKILIYDFLTDGFYFESQFAFILLSFDRYCCLFNNYSPYLRRPTLFGWISIPPIIAAGVLHNRNILTSVSKTAADGTRPFIVCFPALISLILITCSLVGLSFTRQQVTRSLLQRSPKKEFPITCGLFVVASLNFLGSYGLFFELLENVFKAKFLSPQIRTVFYQISHILVLAFPLYSLLTFILCSEIYRSRTRKAISDLVKMKLLQKKTTLNYSTETLRTIIADQRRSRHFKAISAVSARHCPPCGKNNNAINGKCRQT